MQIRRCSVLFLEPREDLSFDFDSLLNGGDGLVCHKRWLALAPHRDAEVEVTPEEIVALGEIDSANWIDATSYVNGESARDALLNALLGKGLVLGNTAEHAELLERDERLRDTHWRPLSAALHYASRWGGVRTGEEAKSGGLNSMRELAEKLGNPPPEVVARADPSQRLALARPAPTPIDDLLAQRTTCRNFDGQGELPQALFAQIMLRVYGAQAVVEIQPHNIVLKKTSPSGGGLHPTAAYVIVQRVAGIAPGLYHYHPVEHALEPMRVWDATAAAEFADRAVAGQAYFANAPVLIVMTCRFGRKFWKYRNHPKAYRSSVLDVGHLSQTLYLSATEFGLGAFITAAINEKDIEVAFGLDPLVESPIAVSGFGYRAAQRQTVEFDPQNKVWPEAWL